jgi:hypothetical protein
MVSTESGRLLEDPDRLAVDLAGVRHEGNGVYAITTSTDEKFRLIKRVGPLDPGVKLEYAVDVPGVGPEFTGDDVPTIDLTLSERLVDDEVAPMLAKVLAESSAVLRGAGVQNSTGVDVGSAPETDGDRVFGPGGTPDVDAVQRPVDAGLRAELRQRGMLERRLSGESTAQRPGGRRSRRRTADAVRRAAVRREIRKLALTMGVADGQPNAKLLRTLLTEDERAILDRVKDPARRPLEERVGPPGYLAKALGGSGVSSVVIGTAAAAFTGNPLVGVGIAVPTIVNAAVGSVAERRLDRQKASGRKPAYAADRKQREHDYPGLLALLDGPERVRPPVVKMPRATAWRNYLVRHSMPTLATAAVAGALTPFGVPALPTAMVIASSALAKSLAERLVDTKKLEFRLRRIDATERLRLSDPTLYVNQLATEFSELRTRLDRVVAELGTAPGTDPSTWPGVTQASSDVPGAPPFTVSLSAQLIENVSGAARRAFVGGRSAVDVDPTALARHVGAQAESLLSAVGPGLLGAVTGAMGDKYFLNRDEAARDASKRWSRSHQEAEQAAALAGILEPRLRLFRELTDGLEELTGVSGDLSARAADRGLPVVTDRPTGPRPPARAPWSAYAAQVAAGSLGGVAGAVGLDLVLDLPDLAVVLTVAGATGSMTATPVARYLFRHRELQVHEELETNKAVRAVNQSELLEQRAITRYLMTQLSMRADAIVQHTAPRRVMGSPSETSPFYTDHVRAAVRRAELDNVPSGQPETASDRDARAERVQVLEQVDRWAAEVDRLEALGAPGEPLANAREKVRFAIERYESIADGNGMRRAFPDLGAVDPDRGRRVVGGVTDQARSGVEQAVRRLVAEPSGKPLLAERLITLEQLSRAADAVDHHAIHGTDESRAYVQEQFDQTLEEAGRLWREAGVPNGLVLPALAVTPPLEPERSTSNPEQVGEVLPAAVRDHNDEDEKLRRMVDQLLGSGPGTRGGRGVRRAEGIPGVRRADSSPGVRPAEGSPGVRRAEGGPGVRRVGDGGRGW